MWGGQGRDSAFLCYQEEVSRWCFYFLFLCWAFSADRSIALAIISPLHGLQACVAAAAAAAAGAHLFCECFMSLHPTSVTRRREREISFPNPIFFNRSCRWVLSFGKHVLVTLGEGRGALYPPPPKKIVENFASSAHKKDNGQFFVLFLSPQR